jgi:oligoribonuclease NrnB/cAMP/cGMP phosphodiesterase (DHH superfamily)
MTQATKAVVIYHQNCVDGFTSAWAFHRLKEKDYVDGVTYIPASYGQDFPSFPDGSCDLFILDFSYKREQIEQLCGVFDNVTLLDHHKTAQADLQGLIEDEFKPLNLEIVFDMNRSGAGITWDYFEQKNRAVNGLEGYDPKYDRPALVNYVEDRDLWKFKLLDSKEVNAVIGMREKTHFDYDQLSDALQFDFETVAITGGALLEQTESHCASIIAATKRPCTIHLPTGKYHGLICNCPGQFASDVGNKLAIESGTFGASFFIDNTGAARFSLRSIGDYDVSELAKSFGGGGHKNAAGFAIASHDTVTPGEVNVYSDMPNQMEGS